jgi:hypothetical protein
MARNRIHNYLDRKREQTSEQLRKDARLLNRVRIKAIGRYVSDIHPRWVEQDRLSQFSEDMRERIQEGGP